MSAAQPIDLTENFPSPQAFQPVTLWCCKCLREFPEDQVWSCDIKFDKTCEQWYCFDCAVCYRLDKPQLNGIHDICSSCVVIAFPTATRVAGKPFRLIPPQSNHYQGLEDIDDDDDDDDAGEEDDISSSFSSGIESVDLDLNTDLEKPYVQDSFISTQAEPSVYTYHDCMRCKGTFQMCNLWSCSLNLCCDDGLLCFECERCCYVQTDPNETASKLCCKACLQMEYQEIEYSKTSFQNGDRKCIRVVLRQKGVEPHIPEIAMESTNVLRFPLPTNEVESPNSQIVVHTPSVSQLHALCSYYIEKTHTGELVAVRGRTLELFEALIFVVRLKASAYDDPRLDELENSLSTALRKDDLFCHVQRSVLVRTCSFRPQHIPSLLTFSASLVLRNCVQRFAILAGLYKLFPDLFIRDEFYVFYNSTENSLCSTEVSQDIDWHRTSGAANLWQIVIQKAVIGVPPEVSSPAYAPTSPPSGSDESLKIDFGRIDFGRQKLAEYKKRDTPEQGAKKQTAKRVRFTE